MTEWEVQSDVIFSCNFFMPRLLVSWFVRSQRKVSIIGSMLRTDLYFSLEVRGRAVDVACIALICACYLSRPEPLLKMVKFIPSQPSSSFLVCLVGVLEPCCTRLAPSRCRVLVLPPTRPRTLWDLPFQAP